MEEKKGINIGTLIKIIVPIIGIIIVGITTSPSHYNNKTESGAIEAAEKRVNQEVYRNLGVVAKSFSSEVVYEDDDGRRLIEVKYGLDSEDWDGTCCVYTSAEYAVGCTVIMGAGYEFDENLEETKALFGL